MNGRKRHIVVDTIGKIMAVVVHSAAIQDRGGAKLAIERSRSSDAATMRSVSCCGFASAAAPALGCGTDICLAGAVTPHEQGLRRAAPNQRVHGPDSHDQPDEPAFGPLSGTKSVVLDEHASKKCTTARNIFAYNALQPKLQPFSRNDVHFFTHTHTYKRVRKREREREREVL